jgi:hypothetical protein
MGASAARDGPLLKPPARSTRLVSSAGSAGRADPWTVDRARRKPSGPEVFVQREKHHPFTDSQFARHAQSLRRTLALESRGANSIAFARVRWRIIGSAR